MNVFSNGKIGKKREFLENDCDRAWVVVLAPGDGDDAGVAMERAGDDPDEGRFSGPIAAEKRVYFTLRNAKVRLPQDAGRAEAFLDVERFEDEFVGAGRSCRGLAWDRRERHRARGDKHVFLPNLPSKESLLGG